VEKRTNRPVVKGDFNPIFQGIYSSRIEVKQNMRDIERILTSAEKAGVMAEWLGAPSHRNDVERAWEPVLFNQAHDLASGVMVDKVYEDTMLGYGFARRLGDEMLRLEMDTIAAQINSTGDGLPIAVFNLLGWPRTDVVETEAGFSEPGVQALGVVDPAGKPIPVQILQADRNEDGGIRQARIMFIAGDVPAMGYAVYRVISNPTEKPAAPTLPGSDTNTRYRDQGVIENEFYRVSFNLWNGDMTSLVLKENNWEVLRSPGNVIAKEKDGGDFWELYGNLNGGRQVVMNKEIVAPNPARTEWSSDWVGGNGMTRPGPVVSEFRITHPFGKSVYSTRVRLYNGVRRVDVATEIVNQDEFVRYRALFPTSIDAGRNTHDIAFGAIERPEKSEFPAQNWADYGDNSKGLTVLNRGIPGNNVAGGTMMLSLMRSARINSYVFHGGYEPGVSSDSGLALGKRLSFQFALMPHAGDWRAAGSWRAGLEFNNPLIVKTLDAHAGPLPKQWGMLKVSHANAVVSALKPGRDGAAILRVYEASGKATPGVTVQTAATLRGASEANLIEDAGRTLGIRDNQITFDLRPYEIKTFRLQLTPFQSKKP
jgi:alpha-mannosidase